METVYLLGAGFNQCVDVQGQKPPLSNNFFSVLLNNSKFAFRELSTTEKYVFYYIDDYWKYKQYELAKSPVDLEECFTFIEMQCKEQEEKPEQKRNEDPFKARYSLNQLFIKLLAHFENYAKESPIMIDFATRVLSEKPTILTFNYDCILERAIEEVSGLSHKDALEVNYGPSRTKITDDDITYSIYNWNRRLSYGLEFDFVELHRSDLRENIDGKTFNLNPQNRLYDWRILKLHGSINWLKYSGKKVLSYLTGSGDTLLDETDKKERPPKGILLANKDLNNPLWNDANWFVEPVIITPILHKQTNIEPFKNLWNQARDRLEQCERLIVIGYSFPPTDFYVRKLFREAFLNNELKELIVVNPDISIAAKVKELSHFNKPVVICRDLEELLEK